METIDFLVGLVLSVLVLFLLAELKFRAQWRQLRRFLRRIEAANVRVDQGLGEGQVEGQPEWHAGGRGEGEHKGAPAVTGRPRWLRPAIRTVDLAAACTEVASRLHAGSSVAAAWRGTWERIAPGATLFGSEGMPVGLADDHGEGGALVVAATRFSTLTGAPLKDVLFGLARSLNEMEEGASSQSIAFAGPRLSARILNALPFVGLVGGQLLGANPFSWFLSGGLPALVGLAGFGFAVAGNLVSRKMVAAAAATSADTLRAPALCDLVGAGLKGGAAIPAVLDSLGQALGEEEYCRVALELTLGATWNEAWDPTPPGGSLLRGVLQPGWEDGVSPTQLLKYAADDARRRSTAAAKEAAEQLAVKLALPLGGLLLPAFVLLGLVPIFFVLVGNQMGGTFGSL